MISTPIVRLTIILPGTTKVRRKERKKEGEGGRERKRNPWELLKQGLQGIESWRKGSARGSGPTFCCSISLIIGLFWGAGYEGIKDPNEECTELLLLERTPAETLAISGCQRGQSPSTNRSMESWVQHSFSFPLKVSVKVWSSEG